MIFVYAGPGASETGIQHIAHAFKRLWGQTCKVQRCSPSLLIEGSWRKTASLLIMPGGADIPYTQHLNGAGNRQIRSYVEEGGVYWGICAGSYYAAESILFAPGSPLEVKGKRELSFFPGRVEGPFFAPFDYQSLRGVKASPVFLTKWGGYAGHESFPLYYYGGGCFEGAFEKEGIEVLAAYDEQKQKAAMIECLIGRGKAILSGFHFEYDPRLLDPTDPYIRRILPALEKSNKDREELFYKLLERSL